MTHSASAIANYFIRKSIETGIELTPMKVIKLVYIAHGFHLAAMKEPLIGEAVQAWKYGPVIEPLYHALKSYGNGQITSPIRSFEEREGGLLKPVEEYPPESLHSFLDLIWDNYSSYSGGQLSTLTHQKGTAWDEVWNNRNGKFQSSAIIPNNLISERFESVGS